MNILQSIPYVDTALAGTIVLLAGVHYMRLRRSVFPYVAAGGVLYTIHFIMTRWVAGEAPVGYIVAWIDLFESGALFLWFVAAVKGDHRLAARLATIIFLTAGGLICAAILAGNIATPTTVFYYPLIIYYDITIVIFTLFYSVSSRKRGIHYIFQTSIFIGIALSLAVYKMITGGVGNSFVIPVASIAYGFGFISMILYTDSAAAAALGREISRRELRAAISAAVSQAAQKLEPVTDNIDRAEFFSHGMSILAETMQERLGFGRILVGRRADTSNGFLYSDFPGGGNKQTSISVKLPDLLVKTLNESREPILVPDAGTHPLIHDYYFELIGMKSFVIVPLTSSERMDGVMLIGLRGSGAPFVQDAGAVSFLAAQITLFVSYLHLHGEAVIAPVTDAVSLLRNFTSFQKLLSDSIDDADKTGTSLSLIFYDVDHFSTLNEKLGFERGDQLLRDIGVMLSKHAPPGYTGRVGADEFAQILSGMGEEVRDKIEEALPDVAEKIKQAYSDANITISAAYSIYPYDFFDRTDVFSKMREMMAMGRSATSRIVRVKMG